MPVTNIRYVKLEKQKKVHHPPSHFVITKVTSAHPIVCKSLINIYTVMYRI